MNPEIGGPVREEYGYDPQIRDLDHRLPNRFMHYFFRAVQEQIGLYSFYMMLRQAGLERYIDQLPRLNRGADIYASEYARFQKEIRVYYGKGSRGLLNRVGRRLFHYLWNDFPFPGKIGLLRIRLLPGGYRSVKCLDWLAGQLGQPDGKATVHTFDTDLVFVVFTSAATCCQSASDPICWVTQGMIQEALSWAGDEEPEIIEICCRAAGGENCTFQIRYPSLTNSLTPLI